MEAIHLDSRRKKGKCYEESLDKLGGSEATEQQELEWWVFPGTVWEDRLVGYWRVGTRATEMHTSADREKVWLWTGSQDVNHYAVALRHTVPRREVLMSLKTHRPIRDSRPTRRVLPDAVLQVPCS